MSSGWRLLLRNAVIGSALMAASFGGGWLAFGWHHDSRSRVRFDFSKPYVIPRGYEPLTIQPTLDTEAFAIGDRIDILVSVDGVPKPLILDAVVTKKAKHYIGLIAPLGGRGLLMHARESGLQLHYRSTVVAADPLDLVPHGS